MGRHAFTWRRLPWVLGLLTLSFSLFASADDFDLTLQELLEVEDDGGRLGDAGRLLIPQAGINVALFYAEDNDDGGAQALTDQEDSAVYMPWVDDQYLIADHWTQGFINIRDCQEGTAAYIKKPDVIEKYLCREITTGHNLETRFLIHTDRPHLIKKDWETQEEAGELKPGTFTYVEETTQLSEDGDAQPETEVFYGTPLEALDDFDLFMYTCNGRWQDIYIALFTFDEAYAR